MSRRLALVLSLIHISSSCRWRDPLRAQNYATLVPGKKSERTVFTMAKFTIPDDKCLVVELNEKNGGRHPVSYTHLDVYKRQPLVRFNVLRPALECLFAERLAVETHIV